MCVVKLFTPLTFSLILTKLGAHNLCANVPKTVGKIYEILIFKFFWQIFKILHCDTAAVELSRPTSLSSLYCRLNVLHKTSNVLLVLC